MNKAFEGLIGKTVEVYVDDIITKSNRMESALDYLRQVFDRVRKI